MAFVALNLFHEKAIVTLAIASLLIVHFKEALVNSRLGVIQAFTLQKEAMKITEVQTCKQINSTVDLNLDSIKTAIHQLDELFGDEKINADEVNKCYGSH